ncbi:hypothetical protein ASG85_20090 [Paenibacillus sp. Soil724D2]|nr:hypothetical protein ASG85_20090 [Paenibacillus sp. Soil724D2]
MRKPLSKPFKDERPRFDVVFIANRKAVFWNRKIILSYVVAQKNPLPPIITISKKGFLHFPGNSRN